MPNEPEKVHTVSNYYDGPRSGIVDYQGKPHAYESLRDESVDDGSDVFLLQPLDEETFRLAMEDWEIWCRWRHAYDQGETDTNTHPALPTDRARHESIKTIVEPRMKIDDAQAIRVRGFFRVELPSGDGASKRGVWVVRWADV